MAWDWESELPALADLTDEQAAATIAAMTVEADVVPVRLSFRDLANLLDHDDIEYQTIRAVLETAIAAEKAAGGYLLSDMKGWLETAEGLDFANTKVIAKLEALCASSEVLAGVPDTIASHVASQQPSPGPKYLDPVTPGQVHSWRTSQ